MTTTITTTVPSRDLQAPVLLGEAEMNVVTGGNLIAAFMAGFAVGTVINNEFGLSNMVADWAYKKLH